MAKPIYVLTFIDPDDGHELLGVYSEESFAKTQAQVHINSVNDNYDYQRVELKWKNRGWCLLAESSDEVDRELVIEYTIERFTLDEDVKL